MICFLAFFALPCASMAENSSGQTGTQGKKSASNTRSPKAYRSGHLLIRANFKTHSIKINGEPYPSLFKDVGIDLPPNKVHQISVSTNDGAFTKNYQVSLDPGENLVLFLEISAENPKNKKNEPAKEKKKEDAGEGYVSVTAVADAQVYLDGKMISGKVPLRKYAVTAGSHSVRVFFTETKKNSKTREVYIAKGATMNLHFNEE